MAYDSKLFNHMSIVERIVFFFYPKHWGCGGWFTDGGGYSHLSCSKCGAWPGAQKAQPASIDTQDLRELLHVERENCICAAVQASDGMIVRGHRHADAMRTLREIPGYGLQRPHGDDQGFVTSFNRYVTRAEGRALQDAAGIESADPGGYRGNDLYSEDLY